MLSFYAHLVSLWLIFNALLSMWFYFFASCLFPQTNPRRGPDALGLLNPRWNLMTMSRYSQLVAMTMTMN